MILVSMQEYLLVWSYFRYIEKYKFIFLCQSYLRNYSFKYGDSDINIIVEGLVSLMEKVFYVCVINNKLYVGEKIKQRIYFFFDVGNVDIVVVF